MIINKLVVLGCYASIVTKIQAKVSLLSNLGWKHMAAVLHRLSLVISVSPIETDRHFWPQVESVTLSIPILAQPLGSHLFPSHPLFVADSLTRPPSLFPIWMANAFQSS